MSRHVPILVEPIVQGILPAFEPAREPSLYRGLFVDCTLGGGGHCARFLQALAPQHRVLAIDQDARAIEQARERFAPELASGRLEIHRARISELGPLLAARRAADPALGPLLGMMADLGFSSDQIDDPARGLSFRFDGPLDMRLDPSRGLSAREYLEQATERELEETLRELGEERLWKRIADAIVRARRERRLPETTAQLVQLIVRATPANARHGRIHVATRTFQALRVRVNEELEELDALLKLATEALVPGGRIAVLSFHSLEDRRVKHAFRGDAFEPLTKKPIEADEAETEANPRARSAKLRVAERVRDLGL